jgi:hypothetical protein
MSRSHGELATTLRERIRSFDVFGPRGRSRIPIVVAWVAGLACIVALAHRFRFAADLTDESFSISMPYRFALGDKPFVDEVAIQQTSGLVLFPFVWLFVKLTGGSTGLVLYVRLVHLLVFKGAAAFSVHAAARRLLRERSSAIAVSFVPFAFVPHSIPNVGYNVIGMTLLTVGSFLTVAGMTEVSQKRRLRLFFLAGLAQGIMAFAYPPMAVAPLLATPLVLLCAGKGRWSALLAFIAGGASSVILISPALIPGGIAGLKRSLGWGVHANATHNSDRAKALLDAFWKNVPSFYPYALVAIVVAWVLRSRSLVAIVIPAITLLLTFWFRDEWATHWGAIRTVSYTGALAPALLLLAKPDRVLLRAAILIVLPSLAAAGAAAFVSTQGVDAASLGLASSMSLFAILAARSLERVNADATYCMLPSFALMLVLVTRCYDYVYRDGQLAQLTQTVADGPFKWIRTTPDRAQAFAEMSQITKTYDHRNGRILFLWEASGYYLFSRMKPNAHSVWEETYGDLDGLLAYWESHVKGHGIIVRIKGSGQSRIDAVVTPPERRIQETRHFIVYADH